MNKKLHEIETFRQFAEKKLENHESELKTRYQNRAIDSQAMIRQAHIDHKKLFEQELDAQIALINKNNNAWLKAELDNLKDDYLKRLSAEEN